MAIFLAFQSQAWHTDDVTGHALPAPMPDGDRRVRIVGALVNPVGPAPEAETVTLLNITPEEIDLAGWSLVDRAKNRCPLAGRLGAGEAVRVAVEAPVQLGNRGGAITLLDESGLKVDGVAYTEAREGWTLVF